MSPESQARSDAKAEQKVGLDTPKLRTIKQFLGWLGASEGGPTLRKVQPVQFPFAESNPRPQRQHCGE